MSTWKLVISYKGEYFSGSQIQPGKRTVQEELENAWEKVTGSRCRAVLAGRTDAGVSALGQVATIKADWPGTPEELLEKLRKCLTQGIEIQKVERVSDNFDARKSAIWRRYRYVFSKDDIARFGFISVESMRQAARALVGEKDFAAFASQSELGPRGTVRRILDINVIWDKAANKLYIEIVADAFLRQMVRRIVSALIWVGTGKIEVVELLRAVEIKARQLLPGPAPAKNLTLVEVGYGEC